MKFDKDSPEAQAAIARATRLADQDERMLSALVRARREAGLSQQDVADALGWKVEKVARFERYDSDPRQSTVRRYAFAVGVHIDHAVTVAR